MATAAATWAAQRALIDAMCHASWTAQHVEGARFSQVVETPAPVCVFLFRFHIRWREEGKGVCFSGLLTGLCVWASGHSALACCSRWERNKDSTWIGCWVSAICRRSHLAQFRIVTGFGADVCVCLSDEGRSLYRSGRGEGEKAGRPTSPRMMHHETPQELLISSWLVFSREVTCHSWRLQQRLLTFVWWRKYRALTMTQYWVPTPWNSARMKSQ